MKKLPISLEVELRNAIKERKLSITQACSEFGISRMSYYRLINKVDKVSAGEAGRSSLRLTSDKLISLVKSHPTYSCKDLVDALKGDGIKITSSKVAKILKELKLNKISARRRYQAKNNNPIEIKAYDGTEEARRLMLLAREKGEKVSRIAKLFGVSRWLVYKWAKRYDLNQSLTNKVRVIEHFWHQATDDQVQLVLKIVRENPELSTHKISNSLPQVNGKPILGNHGVQNVLRRLNLNKAEKRVAWVNAQTPVPQIQTAPSFGDRLRSAVEIFTPQTLPAPPPADFKARLRLLLKPFSYSFGITSASTFILLNWLSIFAGQSIIASIGLFFATIALLTGTFFFLYSMKSYLVMGLVLSFSNKDEESLIDRKRKTTFWSLVGKIFGVTAIADSSNEEVVVTENKYTHAGGLQANLDHINIERYPFVSIQLPYYNEKKVAERSIRAAAGMNYPNFEVLVCDDSSDETIQVVEKVTREVNEEIGREVVKILHRPTRTGFKGGALSYALKAMNPKTEFVVVFDADFVPYPDTLTQFVKYYKSTGTWNEAMDFRTDGIRTINYDTNEEVSFTPEEKAFFDAQAEKLRAKNSNAVVAGYQWHVLNKSENWITRGVRTEYSGSYVIERPGQEIMGAMKIIHGSVYMMRADVLKHFGWGTSITEDYELTLRIYEKGFKVIYTPYVQAPSECVSTIKRLIRQRMRWAEGHSYNTKKMFKKLFATPYMTKMEKVEFGYLTPYYLQAALFIVGTLAWLISETIFKVRLPFWTSLWGWSLVLTNLFALPLMNAVGLFLEEAEEKDYLGIFSFIALCYIVVPFQAYAAIKGFIEPREGTWFRTPKTGKVTDTLVRGRFYKWVTNILPNFKPASGGIANMRLEEPEALVTVNPYYALQTAHNTFNQFSMSRKRNRYAGKLMLSIMLLVSTIIMTFSPMVPYFVQPANAQGFGMLTGPNETPSNASQTAEEISYPTIANLIPVISPIPEGDRNQPFEVAYPQLESGIPTDAVSTVTPTPTTEAQKANMVKPAPVKQSNNESIKLKLGKHDFKVSENVEVNLEQDKVSDYQIKVKRDGMVKELEIKEEKVGNKNIMVIEKPRIFQPGKYVLEITDSNNEVTTQEFTWGVLAVNTNKSIYLPGEWVYLQMAALDDQGHTICNADLSLEITDPQNKKESQTISFSDTCGKDNVTDKPDYSAYYQIGVNTGTYNIDLLNKGTGYSLKDSFEVKESVPFVVERTGATRINPFKAEYQMKLDIKANQAFKGQIEETLPEGFEVKNSDSNEYIIEKVGSEVKISWNVDLENEEEKELVYVYRAPGLSPEFFLIGPLGFRNINDVVIFSEARSWQLASDASLSFIGSAETSQTANDDGWTEIADLNGVDSRIANASLSYKKMGATPDTEAYVNIHSANAANTGIAIAYAFRNVNTSTPLDVTPVTAAPASNANSALFDSPSISPSTAGTIVVSAGSSTAGAAAGDQTITMPGGYSNQADHYANGSSLSVQGGFAWKAWSSGAENPAAWSNITSGTSDAWAAFSVALRPVSGQTITYVGTAENSGGTNPYSVDLSGMGLQQNDFVLILNAWSSTTNDDPGISSYSWDISGLGLQQGDLMIIASGGSATQDYNLGIISSGWTEIADVYGNDATRDSNLDVSYKLMGETPDTSVRLFSSGLGKSAFGGVAVAHIWRGVDQNTPIDTTTQPASAQNSALWNSPPITPVTAGAIVLTLGLSTGPNTGGDTSITMSSGYSNQVDNNSNGSVQSVQAGIASKAWSGSGAEDPAAWTNITSGTSDSWTAATVALRPGKTLSGVIYSGEPNTVFDCSGNNLTVSIKVNSSAPITTTCTQNTGAWSKDLTVGIANGNAVNIWVSGQASGTVYAEMVYISDGTTKTDLNFWQNTLAIRSDTASSVTNTVLGNALHSTKGQQVYSVSSGNLMVDSDIELHINDGETFAPGGNVTTQGTGTLHLDPSSTFTGNGTETHVIGANVRMDANSTLTAPDSSGGTITVGGDWMNATASATFTPGSGEIIFNKASGTGNINSADAFYDMTIGGAGTADFTISASIDIDNDLTITSGNTFSPSQDVYIGGSYANSGTYNQVVGNLYFDSTSSGETIDPGTAASNYQDANFVGSGIWSVANHTFDVNFLNLGSGTINNSNGTADIVVRGQLGCGASTCGTINMTSSLNTVNIRGDYADETFGQTQTTTADWTFYNLKFENSSASSNRSVTIIDPTSHILIINGTLTVGNASDSYTTTLNNEANDETLDVNGNFVITSKGEYKASSTVHLLVGGNYTNSGTYTQGTDVAGADYVDFDATTTGKIITPGTSHIGNVGFVGGGGGGWSIATNTLYVDGWFFLEDGTLDNSNGSADIIAVGPMVCGWDSCSVVNLTTNTVTVRGVYDGDFGFTTGVAYTMNSNWTFNNLKFETSRLDAGRIVTIKYDEGTGKIVVSGTLTIGNASDAQLTHLTDNDSGGDETLDIDGNLVITSKGSFTAPNAVSLTVGGDWTNNTGTFNHNSGTVVFNKASGTATIDPGGEWNSVYDFGSVNFGDGGSTATYQLINNQLYVTGDLTIDTGDTLDTNTEDIWCLGSWTNSGSFNPRSKTVWLGATDAGNTINNNASSFNYLAFFGDGGHYSPLTNTLTVDADLRIERGYLDNTAGTADITVGGSVWCADYSSCGVINLTTSTMTLRGSGAATFGHNPDMETVSDPETFPMTNNWNFYNLKFENSNVGADRTITVQNCSGDALCTGDIITSGTLTIGNASDSFNTILENDTYDETLDNNGNMVITSKGVFEASSATSFSVGDDFTNNGTFYHNNGGFLIDDAAKTTTLLYSAPTAFWNVYINTASKVVQFDNVDRTTAAGLTVNGSACSTQVQLTSASAGNQFEINVTSAHTIQYAFVKDSYSVTALTATNSKDGGNNNANWSFTGGSECNFGILRKANFETGNLAEFDSKILLSGSVNLTTSFANHGSYGIDTNTGASINAAAAQWDSPIQIADDATKYLSGYFKIDSGYTGITTPSSYVVLACFGKDGDMYTNTPLCFRLITDGSGDIYPGIQYYASGIQQSPNGSTELSTNTTYQFELAYREHASSGYVGLWINGTEQVVASSLNTSANAAQDIAFGQVLTVGEYGHIYFDDIVLADGPIGTLPPANTYTDKYIYKQDFEGTNGVTSSKAGRFSKEIISGASSTLDVSTEQNHTTSGSTSLKAYSQGLAGGDLSEPMMYMSENVASLSGTLWTYYSSVPNYDTGLTYTAVLHQGDAPDLAVFGFKQDNGACSAGQYKPMVMLKNGPLATDFDYYYGNCTSGLTGNWAKWEFYYKRDNSTGAFWVKVNGVEVIRQTNLNTLIGGELTSFSMIAQSNAGPVTVYFDDVQLVFDAELSDDLTASAFSFQRKVFYDETNATLWSFIHDGNRIQYFYSEDNGAVFNLGGTFSTDINTYDFSVWDDNTYVYIAYTNDYSIRVQRGTLTASSITWGAEYTAITGSSSTDMNSYPYITQDSAGYLWVTATFYDGTYYRVRAKKSAVVNNVSSWATETWNLSSASNTNANCYGMIASINSSDMYSVYIADTGIAGKKWTNGSGSWSTPETSIATGTTGTDKNFSVTADTSFNLHLAYIDSSDDVYYKKYNGTNWTSADATIDTSGTNRYVTTSVDSDNDYVYVMYIDTSDSKAYYKLNSGSWGSVTDTGWTMRTSPRNLTSNFADPTMVFAQWTAGTGYPYSILWNSLVVVPEHLWFLLGLGLVLPKLMRRKKVDNKKFEKKLQR